MEPTMKRILLALLSIGIIGCSGEGENGDKLTAIRFMNLMTDTNRVVFQVRESTFPAVGFRLATPYQSFGGTYEYDLELVDAGGLLSTLIEDRVLTIDGDNGWTFYAVGTVATPEFFAVSAANGAPAAGSAKTQIVNATRESLTVSVYADGQAGSGLQYSATVGGRRNAAPTDVPAQAVQLRVERADGTVVFDSTSFELSDQDDVTFVITDYLGPGPAVTGGEVLLVHREGLVSPLATTGRSSTLRYVHALTNLPDAIVTRTDSVQASADTTLSFATVSTRESVQADTYDLSVAPADNIGAPVYSTSETLDGGIEYSSVLVDDLAAPGSFLLVDDTRPVVTHARLSFIHAAAGLATVDVYIAPSEVDNFAGAVFEDVAYRSGTGIDLAPQSYNFTVTTPDTLDILAGPFEVDLAADSVGTLLLHEATTGGEPYAISVP